MNYMRQSTTFLFDKDPFKKGAQGIVEIFHEVLLIMKLLQTKTQVKKKKIN